MATQKMTFRDMSSGGEFDVLVPDPKEGENTADLIRSAVVAAVGSPLTESEFRGYLCTRSRDAAADEVLVKSSKGTKKGKTRA